eukprot:6066195-Amphidinium_carterae.1
MFGCRCCNGSAWEVQGSLKVSSNSELQGSANNLKPSRHACYLAQSIEGVFLLRTMCQRRRGSVSTQRI